MLKDMIGFKGEYFTVVEYLGFTEKGNDGKRRRLWKCICKCGKEKILKTGELNYGSPRSCGCHKRVGVGNYTNHSYLIKHGLAHRGSKHPIYKLWMRIKNRCYTTNVPKDMKNYRNRGIVMHDTWKNDPRAFYDWCISNGWKLGLSIDRIDNDGNYEPSNCQFLTVSENSLKMWKDKRAKQSC